MLVLTLAMLAPVFAQAPQAFNFQAVVRNAAGNLVSEENVDVTLSILSGSASGAKVYEETFNAKTDKAGVLSLSVGKGASVSGRFPAIEWKEGTFYLKTSIRLPGEAQTHDMGAIQLLSVPYALYAETAGSGGNGGIFQQEPSREPSRTINNYYIREGSLSIKSQTTNNDLIILSPYDDPETGFVGVMADGDLTALMASAYLRDGYFGMIGLYDQKGEGRVGLAADEEDAGIFVDSKYGETTEIRSYGVTVYDGDMEKGSLLVNNNDNTGQISLYGTNGNANVSIGNINGNGNSGGVWTGNRNGRELVSISALESNPDNGGIAIYSASGRKGQFYVDSDDKSCLIVDGIYDNDGYSLTSATMDYSSGTRSSGGGADPCYVTETADNQIVVRGTAWLQNGQYTVTLPADAASKIREQTLTVQVTPLSSVSKGLAVTDKQTGRFTVTELMSGNGSYEIDWTLTALRRNDPELRSLSIKAKVAGPAASATKVAAPLRLKEALNKSK
jgi:hypothetical protein